MALVTDRLVAAITTLARFVGRTLARSPRIQRRFQFAVVHVLQEEAGRELRHRDLMLRARNLTTAQSCRVLRLTFSRHPLGWSSYRERWSR